ncbi:Zn-dependent hydrolase [Leptolyngbya cf. ectocarpi LEGE 11479]|uniref:Zn-dependent hydrolase n=1 Tax=Leptolyngbya cf. ectocarpi LEGE 11479 TaxID=1828722 RepID=A0A928ZUV1_LEPEC|nr:Zn-dependent hydrolase [Leptolyngbya ectocarpi]MBE9067815.1 Zn-dependent hydrolase [Leptolyngbya cf. ectocarpi LEGE 11479]
MQKTIRPSTRSLTINSCRLQQTIAELATIGALPTGGIRRLAFSDDDIRARAWVQEHMAAAGMTVTIDAAGNLIGQYPGQYPDAPALATGSHLDSVPDGGIYDGTYGVLAGLEVVRTLYDHDIQLNHPIEVIVFADEEGTMIGSKAMGGKALLNLERYYSTGANNPIENNLKRLGGDWEQLPSARRDPRSLVAFVELHIEQGPVLEATGNTIGLVTGVVGQRRYVITVTGQASHAGTTPMSMRQDALVAASQLVLAIHRIGCLKDNAMTGEQVATVGMLTPTPNVANTVPGHVEMVVGMRDLSNDCLDQMEAMLVTAMDDIAKGTQTRIQIHPTLRNEPVLVNSHIYNTIASVSNCLGLKSQSLPSRASHDAQNMASVTDMGMIFVPSRSGLSHASAEYTAPEQCAQGANVLLHTLMQLDQHYRCRLEAG